MYRANFLSDMDCKSVFTLNTWTEDKKASVRDFLERGYWVHLGSSCIGHTMAAMVERDGIRWLQEEYGDRVEVVQRDGWNDLYCRLKN